MEDLYHFLTSIRWQDTVDVVINSYILFRLYVLFRGTPVFRVLVGIAFLWFFQRMAVFLGLIVTSWALQGIITAAAILIIVVFRNEIRSVLQAKNLRTILWGFSLRGTTAPLETIVESVHEMARRHTGGLIVFPGQKDLREYVHSGIPWHGLISKEMILSIFWKDNPVHDGAVILEGDRISEVGAILPLTRRDDLPSHYGTRHRAALGLAENTDALILLISEERGKIAVAKGTTIKTARGKAELLNLLRDHLNISEKPEGQEKRRKVEFVAAGVLSLLVISAVWFSFTKGLESLITLEVPIEYMNRDSQMELMETSTHVVQLNLSGSGSLIKSIKPEQVSIRIDLSDAVVGVNTYTITEENINLPPGVHLKKVEPQTVEVVLDVFVKRILPVQVDWVGAMPNHLILKSAKLKPENVEILGGSQILKNISTIYTEKVSLDQLKESGKLEVKLALHPASLKLAPESKDRIIVEYVVELRRPKGNNLKSRPKNQS
jgi:uncharacterized protein (TIGR00159 family)